MPHAVVLIFPDPHLLSAFTEAFIDGGYSYLGRKRYDEDQGMDLYSLFVTSPGGKVSDPTAARLHALLTH